MRKNNTVHIVPGTFLGKFYKWYVHSFLNHIGKTRATMLLRKLFPQGIVMIDLASDTRFILDINDLLTGIIIQYGNYEPKSLKLCLDILQVSEGCFLDVGSNFGLYTCLAAKGLKKNTIAIDASYKAFGLLQRNIWVNQINNVTACNVALSADKSIQYFSPFNEANLGSSRIVKREDLAANKFLIDTSRLQDILEEIDPPRIALMKMDVEGSELEVLKSIDLQGRYRPENILLEYEPENNKSVPLILDHLIAHRYNVFTIDGTPYTKQMFIPENNLFFKSVG